MLRQVFWGSLAILLVGLAAFGIWIGRFVDDRAGDGVAVAVDPGGSHPPQGASEQSPLERGGDLLLDSGLQQGRHGSTRPPRAC